MDCYTDCNCSCSDTVRTAAAVVVVVVDFADHFRPAIVAAAAKTVAVEDIVVTLVDTDCLSIDD